MEKIENIMVKNQIFNSWIQEILVNFVNLIASLHMLDHKPNAHTQKSCAEELRSNLKNCWKKSKLKSSFQGDSKPNFHSNSLLKVYWVYSNQNHPSKLQELVTRIQTVSRNFQNRASWFVHTLQFLFIDSCLLWVSETNHAN